MLTREDDVDAHKLHAKGWTISAIARHLGHDRKTIRAYLAGDRVAGERVRAGDDRFEKFVDYVRARLVEDPHLWATTLLDELEPLGYDQSYQSLTRQIRNRGLRPVCEACRPAKGRPVAVIAHPPGEETQWDWVELPDPPPAWGWGSKAFLFVGALSHSSKWRGRLAESMDQAHVIDGLDRVTRDLGGLSDVWRFDRMATVCYPATGKITASFAAVVKHYGVGFAICPPRHGNRKGVVEKANHSAAQRWWRTLADDVTVEAAQESLDRLCVTRFDRRLKVIEGVRAAVGDHAERERLRPVPAVAFPATIAVDRQVTANGQVAYRGNFYSVPPELFHAMVRVTERLGDTHINIVTANGTVIARHQRAGDGTGVLIANHSHVTALNAAALAGFTQSPPHRSKVRIPPGDSARAAAAVLRGDTDHSSNGTVIDLARYAQAANERNTLT